MLRAAIIGTGRIGSSLEKDPLRGKPHSHAGWYSHHPGTRLVAGADTDACALEEFGRDWKIGPNHLYEDYRAMLEAERPDVVSICAWARDRVAMCRAAVEAGARGLWIEKAIACSLTEAEALAADLARAGVTAIVDHPRRADAGYRAVKRIIESGAAGRLESVHAVFSGHWLHTGTHAWDILDFWCGRWARVSAFAEAGGGHVADGRLLDARRGQAVAADAAWDDRGGHGHVVFENGVHAFVTASAKRYFIFQFDLVFDAGRITIGNDGLRASVPAPSSRYSGFVELEDTSTEALVTRGDEHPFPMVYDLVDAMEHRRRPLMSVENAVEALRLGVAMFQSGSLGGRWLSREDVDRDLRVATV